MTFIFKMGGVKNVLPSFLCCNVHTLYHAADGVPGRAHNPAGSGSDSRGRPMGGILPPKSSAVELSQGKQLHHKEVMTWIARAEIRRRTA